MKLERKIRESGEVTRQKKKSASQIRRHIKGNSGIGTQ